MSQHEGVSCDACLKGKFEVADTCLICYNYDLGASCYESSTTTGHTTDHPVQCILARVEFDLYYVGEAFSAEQPQSFFPVVEKWPVQRHLCTNMLLLNM